MSRLNKVLTLSLTCSLGLIAAQGTFAQEAATGTTEVAPAVVAPTESSERPSWLSHSRSRTPQAAELAPEAVPAVKRTKPTASKKVVKRAGAPQAKTVPCQVASNKALHHVKPGDTLQQIAQQHRIPVAKLMAANGLSSAGMIKAGQVLQLSAAPVAPAKAVKRVVTQQAAAPKNYAAAQAKAALPSHIELSATKKQNLSATRKNISDESLPVFGTTKADLPAEEKLPLKADVTGTLNTPGMLIGLVVKLGLVLGIAYLGALGLKRLSGLKGAAPRSEGALKIIETTSLGANRWLHIVAIGEQAYLISSTPQQTALLAELKDSPALQQALSKPQEANFAGKLGQLLVPATDAPSAGLSGASNFLAEKIADLRSLRAGTARLGD